MEFTLSLAHFCENDGPTSILCTQVLPVSCGECWPSASRSSSIRAMAGGGGAKPDGEPERLTARGSSPRRDLGLDGSSFDMADLHEALLVESATSPAETMRGQSEPRGRSLETKGYKPYKVLGDDGGCVSCSISLPEDTISQLPSWAPGSPKKDGTGRNGSPVMRTTEKVFAHWSQHCGLDAEIDSKFHQSLPESLASNTSILSGHPHELIYRTTSSPIDPNTYSILRRSTIRTLSCEQLPRGLTAGALSFFDPADGHTVAFKFRLSDPHARGSQRYYALIALIGHDSTRMSKTTPIIWRAFKRIAAGIMARTEKVIAQGKLSENSRGGRKPPLPVSSFLTGRTLDPDGYPRRSGAFNMRARGLAEMVGDELIFAHVHGEFTYLLQSLCRQVGEVAYKAPAARSKIEDSFHDSPYRSLEDVLAG